MRSERLSLQALQLSSHSVLSNNATSRHPLLVVEGGKIADARDGAGKDLKDGVDVGQVDGRGSEG